MNLLRFFLSSRDYLKEKQLGRDCLPSPSQALPTPTGPEFLTPPPPDPRPSHVLMFLEHSMHLLTFIP